MSVVLKFPEKNANKPFKSSYKLFGPLSERLGVDVDKVVLERDENEKAKLKRALAKERMKDLTGAIEE
ncbi:hypothetical protein [Bacillus cereus]